ncbi:MAG: VCBS repeat-containing protein [Candidatus Magnetomorum sp.]|nr:VCBS repeat-containing protein [Candidatus Magnetomorum sp.]
MFIQHIKYKTIFTLFLFCLFTTHSLAQTPSTSGVRSQVLSLPDGPGAIEGFGESFEPQLNMGSGTYSIPIKIPPGRANFAPQVSLNFNTGKGNGIIGMGWTFPLMSVRRQTDKGLPKYSDQDTFITESGKELINVQSSETQMLFRLKNETQFMKYTYYPSQNMWTCKDRSGTTFFLTATIKQSDSSKTYAWYISKAVDTNNNQILYHYTHHYNQIYCQYIAYGPVEKGVPGQCHALFFIYENRHDPIIDYRPTFRLSTHKRLKQIVIKTRNQLVRTYTLTYCQNRSLSLLSSVLVSGSDETTLPEKKFYYSSDLPLSSTMLKPVTGLEGASILKFGDNPEDYPAACEIIDFNGDALPDLYQSRHQASDPFEYDIFYENLGNASFIRKPLTQSQSLQLSVQSPNSIVLDIDGDGLSDVVSQKGHNPEDFVFKRNRGGQWDSQDIAFTFPQMKNADDIFFNPDIRALDMNSDKQIDTIRCYCDPQNSGVLFEAFLNNADGSFVHIPQTTPDTIKGLPAGFSQSDGALVIADMNGDRMQDIVLLRDQSNNSLLYWPSMGWGQFDDSTGGYEIQLSDGPDFKGDVSQIKNLHLNDLNGDGLDDLYVISGAHIIFWLNKGSYMGIRSEISIDKQYDPSIATFRVIDIDGDGLKEILFYASHQPSPDYISTGFWYARLFEKQHDNSGSITPNLLYKIDNGMGGTIQMNYQSHVVDMINDHQSGQPWKSYVPFPVSVLKQITESDGNQSYQQTFTYHNGYYDGKEKEFRGFERVCQKEIGDQSVPDLMTSFIFHTGQFCEALKGKQKSSERKNSNGEIFVFKQNQWETRQLAISPSGDDHIIYPYPSFQTIHLIEKGSGTPILLKTEFEYDNYGNLTRQIEHGRDDDHFRDERITEQVFSSAYESGRSHWILNKIVDRKIKDIDGKRISHTRYYYDNQTQTGMISKGNLTQIDQWEKKNQYITSQKKDYDDFGNIIAVYDPLYAKKTGHYRRYIYDTHFNTFPEQEIIYTGNASLPVLTLSATYNPGIGAVTSFTSLNLHRTDFQYDGMGRLISIQKPPDETHTIEFEYVLGHQIDGSIINWVETRKKDDSHDGFLISRQFYDGMGKKIMMRSEGESPEQTIVTEGVAYNSRKKIVQKYLPFFDQSGLDYHKIPEDKPYIKYNFDALNRKIRTNQPQGPDGIDFSTVTYGPLARIVKDEEQTKQDSKHTGCFKRYLYDGLLDKSGQWRLREIRENVKLSDHGDVIQNPVEWVTSYDYDLLNNIEQYTDAQGNQKIWKYDGLERKIFENDPDRGIMNFNYDDAGNLVQTQDANNQAIHYEYDGINRLTDVYYETKDHAPDIEYHYDLPIKTLDKGHLYMPERLTTITDSILNESNYDRSIDLNGDNRIDSADAVLAARQSMVMAENTHGFLAWVKDRSGEKHFSYDERGRKTWIVKRIMNQKTLNFYTAMSYDPMDRITHLTYPDGSLISYIYNNRGLLSSIPGIIEQIHYDPFEKTSEITLACDIDITTENDFRGRLNHMKTVRKHDKQMLWDSIYSYDAVSNIIGVTDQRTSEAMNRIAMESGASEKVNFFHTQSFSYDSLYRLNHASSPAVYGNIHYQYDRIGNLTQKKAALKKPHPLMNFETIVSGGSIGTWYRKGRQQGDTPGPHAITSAGEMLFQYDQNGNMIDHDGMKLMWDVNNRLIHIKNQLKTTDYVYDYEGKRTIKHDMPSNQTVLYINQYSEIRNEQLIKFVVFDHKKIACSNQIQHPGSELIPSTFYLHNHLGSTAMSLSREATVTAQIAYYPYGQIREKTSHTIVYGFSGREKDAESDLMYFKERYYAPHLAGFISVDPMTHYFSDPDKRNSILFDPQQLNPYAYTNHSPIIYFDPTGLWKLWFESDLHLRLGGWTVSELGGMYLYDSEKGSWSVQGRSIMAGAQGHVNFESTEGKIGTQSLSFNLLGFTKLSLDISGLGNTNSQQIQALVKGEIGIFRFKGGTTINADVYKAFKSDNNLDSLLKETEFTIQLGVGKKFSIPGADAGGDVSFGFQGTLSELNDVAAKISENASDLFTIDGKDVYEIFSAY